MTDQNPAEAEIAEVIVAALNLEQIEPSAIDPEAPLFGAQTPGLGLDSIDALEIVLAIQQKFGVELKADDASVTQAFASLRALAKLVTERRASGS